MFISRRQYLRVVVRATSGSKTVCPLFLACPPRNIRCETFELRDRLSEACEAFIANSPERDEGVEGGHGNQGREAPGVALRVA